MPIISSEDVDRPKSAIEFNALKGFTFLQPSTAQEIQYKKVGILEWNFIRQA